MSANSLLILRILSPEGKFVEITDLIAVNISLANDRPIGIRPGHAPLIAETNRGVVTYRKLGEEKQIHIHAGIMEIRNNIVTILTAGEVFQEKSHAMKDKDSEYSRLMETLIKEIMPD